MEQKYVYLSYGERALYNDELMNALDVLKHDMGGEVDEEFDEKEMCLERLEAFLKDKILTGEDYKFLYRKVHDFYSINLPCPCLQTEMEIMHEIWGN